MKISRLPEVDRTKGWSATLGTRDPNPPLLGDKSVDWIVLAQAMSALLRPDA